MSRHHDHPGDRRDLVVFRYGHWWRVNQHGEYSLVSPSLYGLSPGLFCELPHRSAARWALAGMALGLFLGVLLSGISVRG